MSRNFKRVRFARSSNRKNATRLMKLKEPNLNDLNQYEEGSDKSFFERIGVTAALNAVNENKALGIPVTFWYDGSVVQRMPGGSIVPLQYPVTPTQIKSMTGRTFKKGTILYVRTKDH